MTTVSDLPAARDASEQSFVGAAAGVDVSSAEEISELARAASCLTELQAVDDGRLYHDTFRVVYQFLAAATAAEFAGVQPDDLRAATVHARAFVGQESATIAHTQAWPRGYPGDFEIVERMLDGVPHGPPGTLRQALDRCMLQLPIVAQHRAKVAWQAHLVRRALLRKSDVVRVLSIACGGSRDLMLLEPSELARVDVTLIDADPAAIALSSRRLAGLVRSARCLKGNALRSANRLRALGPFDVILVGGLLDYLSHAAAARLLKHALTMLAPQGCVGATNIAAPNPFRLWLELIAGWSLIARDRTAMLELARGCPVEGLALDHTGLTWLLTLSTTDPGAGGLREGNAF